MINSDTYAKLYGIAEGQGGYFTSRQAGEAGVDRSVLSRQVQAGRLRRVRHGVYRLVHFPAAPEEDLIIAWLETGPASVISHDSALALHRLSDALPSEIHVTVPRTASRRRVGIRLHTNHLTPQEITHRNGVAVTTVPRTIADVAASGLSEEFVIQAVREAVLNGLSTLDELLAAARSERVRNLIRKSLQGTVAQ
jgi:predicted transcriptional regulator of viral defense system